MGKLTINGHLQIAILTLPEGKQTIKLYHQPISHIICPANRCILCFVAWRGRAFITKILFGRKASRTAGLGLGCHVVNPIDRSQYHKHIIHPLKITIQMGWIDKKTLCNLCHLVSQMNMLICFHMVQYGWINYGLIQGLRFRITGWMTGMVPSGLPS